MSKEDILNDYAEGTTWEEARDHIHKEAWEEHLKARFTTWLHDHDTIQNVSVRDKCSDFYVGGRDSYPDRFNDDHLNVVGRSSVAFRQYAVQASAERRFVTEVNVHLPPAPEGLKDRINTILAVEDLNGVAAYWGTGALGGMPAPDGVVTPHVVDTDDITFAVAREAISRAAKAYEHAYEGGAHTIKEQL
jgi:hypothetical protein